MQHHQNGAGPPSASNMSLLNSGPILNAGQQADMTTLYNIVDALSKQLADNRAETARLIEAAHRLAVSSRPLFRAITCIILTAIA